VKAHNEAGWGPWSVKRKFAIKYSTIPKTFSFKVSDKTGLIQYALPKTVPVLLRIFFNNGKFFTTPVNKIQSAGNYEISMKGKIPPGTYWVDFHAGIYCQKVKMILAK
jgi:hypothetical protein